MEDEKVSKLLRLKRHESPPEGYFDDFLKEFHRRQRADLLKRSSFSLLMERVNTYFSDPQSQGWAFAPVAAVFLLGFYFIVGMSEDASLSSMPSMAQMQPTAVQPQYLNPEGVTTISYRGPTTLLGTGSSLVPQSAELEPAPVPQAFEAIEFGELPQHAPDLQDSFF